MKTIQTIFLATAVAAVAAGCGKQETGGETETKSAAIPVRVNTAESRTFERRITVQGTVECKVFAEVSARVAGNLDHVAVDEGDRVEAGKTMLFQIDPTKLKKATTIAEQDLNVARASLNVARAQAVQTEAEAKKALLDFVRYQRLHEQGKVSDNEFETHDVRRAQAEAALEVAKAGVELATRKVEQAEAALDIARKDLADATVVAPIDGVVTRRVAEPGEHMSVGKTVVRIENLATKEAVAFLPAAHHAEIQSGETKFRLTLNGRNGGEHIVTYRSPTVDTMLRTFEVKGRIPEDRTDVVPGNLAQLTIVFETRQGIGVPAEAVLYRRGHNLVFVVQDGKAVAREVEIGLTNDGWAEIASGLETGETVVVEGQTLLTDDASVSVL